MFNFVRNFKSISTVKIFLTGSIRMFNRYWDIEAPIFYELYFYVTLWPVFLVLAVVIHREMQI